MSNAPVACFSYTTAFAFACATLASVSACCFATLPFNQEPATSGNGSMVAIKAKSKKAVDTFHETAVKNGGLDAGAPGPRPEDGEIYYAYIRDFDGNKICAYCDR